MMLKKEFVDWMLENFNIDEESHGIIYGDFETIYDILVERFTLCRKQ